MQLIDIYKLSEIPERIAELNRIIAENKERATQYAKRLKRLRAPESIQRTAGRVQQAEWYIQNAQAEILLLTTLDGVSFVRSSDARWRFIKCAKCGEKIGYAPVGIAREFGDIAVSHYICGDAKYE